MTKAPNKFSIAVLCGGPSPERGISLNSARSVSDHLEGESIEIVPIYFDFLKRPHLISRSQLYSNTPSDFDFKLGSALKPNAFAKLLHSVDLVFPAMHGNFGEDGEVQALLEKLGLPFVGSSAIACAGCFDKYDANERIRSAGFLALPSIAISKSETKIEQKIGAFFRAHKINRAIVKPATGGSSIGVHSVSTVKQATSKAKELLKLGLYKRVVVEPFCQGKEFTAVILQNRFDQPVCLLPVEIEADYTKHQIFDYRKKYLPTRQVTYHCPPRFPDSQVEKIQIQAEQLFSLFGLRDFARFDGWVLPDGQIWFSDFNPLSGMEQNSFLFLQAARVGFSHADLLRFIVRNSARRIGKRLAPDSETKSPKRRRVNVLWGGDTAERQVSVMTGTNVWLKLRRSKLFEPKPFLLDKLGRVWALPYALTMNHTVEEMTEVCSRAVQSEVRDRYLRSRVIERLAPLPGELSETEFIPKRMSLANFLKETKTLFIGLHGGIGEDGTLQNMCEQRKIAFNGPDSRASRLCMDKFRTGQALGSLSDYGIYSARKVSISRREWQNLSGPKLHKLWENLYEEFAGLPFLVKPIGDGCSAGVTRLNSASDLNQYLLALRRRQVRIPVGKLSKQSAIIEMPVRLPKALLFEQYIETDKVSVERGKLNWEVKTGWVEITVGITGSKNSLRVLNPSITVASGDVLSVEEKFQGGTGINITPPPERYISAKVRQAIQERIGIVAQVLGLSGYARLDAFVNTKTGEAIIIEANTLPALTPSTVIFHQALAEPKPIYPAQFIEQILLLAHQCNRSRE